MSTLLNLLWFVLGGWISGLLWLLASVILAITIIGLPWVPATLRLASFSAWPFGRAVVSRYHGQEVSLLLNIVWFVFAGWWLALHHLVLAVLLVVTLIGIPFAIQHVKLALISLAPVGKTVIEV
ncbi:YccF domain-containing protein [Caulobacter sp. S45]|uniref:YccF domain-containing protein n=1 Tax=Caulobacter sp. S45 TaxID=1641861 RepID=UPI00131CDE5D|nr:YccF domain-containing protein [Caulobacter sp. S45]